MRTLAFPLLLPFMATWFVGCGSDSSDPASPPTAAAGELPLTPSKVQKRPKTEKAKASTKHALTVDPKL